MNPKPTLLIPVYKGGTFFGEMLNSIAGVSDLFEHVVISLNGDDGTDESLIYAFPVGVFSNLKVLKTPRILSPTKHFYFFIRELECFTKPDNPIFLLAHDDLIIEAHLRSFFEMEPNLKATCVLGDWLVFANKNPIKTERRTALPANTKSVNAGQWLDYIRSKKAAVFTNMSGIIAPLKVLSELKFLYKIPGESHAANFEYCIATSRHNKRVITTTEPLVKIREHALQQGKNIPISAFMVDEMRFRLWLFINLEGESFKKHVLFGKHGLLKSACYPIKYLKYKIRCALGLKTKYDRSSS